MLSLLQISIKYMMDQRMEKIEKKIFVIIIDFGLFKIFILI
jgi:hypothetical protein